jgi:Asp-tRNA(Asn)/Glu-tRNA(Gln) amidotransferase A subunit family amidase
VRDALAAAVRAFGDRVASGWPEWADPERDQAVFGAHLQAFFAAATGQQPPVDQDDPARQQAIQAWERTFEEVDVVLCPVFPAAAPEHDADIPGYEQQACWITYASLCGLPAASVPVGQTRDGLPVGIQVIGPPGGDLTVLRTAKRFHQASS